MTTDITTATLAMRTAAVPRPDSMLQGRSQSGWAQTTPESATP